MGRESSPNFALLIEQGDEPIQEYSLEQLPSYGSSEKALALFSRGQTTDKVKQIQSQYFELIKAGVKNADLRGSGKGSEIVLSNQSKPFAQLEAKLLALLAPLENLYKSEKDVEDAIKKMRQNYQGFAEQKGFDLDSKSIAGSFPTGRGLFNALKCYRDRLKAPLPPDTERMLYLQTELDAKADADFIEVLYKLNAMKELEVQELNFIQVKSSEVPPNKLATIQRKHEQLAKELAQDLTRLNERFYPEIKFGDAEERGEILLSSVMELVTTKEGETPTARLDRCIGMMSHKKTTDNWSKNGPIRFEAGAITQLGATLESLGSEEDWLMFYGGLRDKYKQYTPIKSAQSLKEIRRQLEMAPTQYTHLENIVNQLEATLPPEILKTATTPHLTKIQKVQSITTIGSKVVPGGQKDITDHTGKPKYMVHRAA